MVCFSDFKVIDRYSCTMRSFSYHNCMKQDGWVSIGEKCLYITNAISWRAGRKKSLGSKRNAVINTCTETHIVQLFSTPSMFPHSLRWERLMNWFATVEIWRGKNNKTVTDTSMDAEWIVIITFPLHKNHWKQECIRTKNHL